MSIITIGGKGEYQRVGSILCFSIMFYIWDWKEYNKRNIILRNKYFSLNVFLHERIWIDIIDDTFRICSRKNIFLFICERRWFLFIEFIFRKEYFDMNLGYMRFQQLTLLYMILIWIWIEFHSSTSIQDHISQTRIIQIRDVIPCPVWVFCCEICIRYGSE